MPSQPVAGLFITCLVDLFRPSVGFAAVKLLEAAGCAVEYGWRAFATRLHLEALGGAQDVF